MLGDVDPAAGPSSVFQCPNLDCGVDAEKSWPLKQDLPLLYADKVRV
jgi:hypothetical protein